MIIKIADWIFDVDIAFNMEYSALESKDHCLCVYCRNFYASADRTYPDLRSFLTEFGLDLDAPEELIPHSPTLYDIAYRAKGTVLNCGSGSIWVNGVPAEIQIDDSCIEDFWICFSNMWFPWVLQETPDQLATNQKRDVFSTAGPLGIDGVLFS